MPREEFKREVERYVTGRETEPSDLIYFKVYRSQIPRHREALWRRRRSCSEVTKRAVIAWK